MAEQDEAGQHGGPLLGSISCTKRLDSGCGYTAPPPTASSCLGPPHRAQASASATLAGHKAAGSGSHPGSPHAGAQALALAPSSGPPCPRQAGGDVFSPACSPSLQLVLRRSFARYIQAGWCQSRASASILTKWLGHRNDL